MKNQSAFFAAVLAAFATASIGCGPVGTYRLSWRIAGEAEAQFSAKECGGHGIESFDVVETSADGNVTTFRVPCGQGSISREIVPGRWTVRLNALDLNGRGPVAADGPKAMRGVSQPFDVSAGGALVQVDVVVQPRAACADRVDNDGDGRVDLDDPDCMGDPTRTSESPSAP